MEFLKERVYTAVNADELEIGSKVIMASDLTTLKCYVRDRYGVTELQRVRNEDWIARFEADGMCYALCYLIEEPEEKKLKWTDLRLFDKIQRKDGSVKRLVTGIYQNGGDYDIHIEAGSTAISDNDLANNWEKVKENERNIMSSLL